MNTSRAEQATPRSHELVLPYLSRIFTLAMAILADEEGARELTQKVVLTAMTQTAQFGSDDSFKT